MLRFAEHKYFYFLIMLMLGRGSPRCYQHRTVGVPHVRHVKSPGGEEALQWSTLQLTKLQRHGVSSPGQQL